MSPRVVIILGLLCWAVCVFGFAAIAGGNGE
jgi:hypothetical protein